MKEGKERPRDWTEKEGKGRTVSRPFSYYVDEGGVGRTPRGVSWRTENPSSRSQERGVTRGPDRDPPPLARESHPGPFPVQTRGTDSWTL